MKKIIAGKKAFAILSLLFSATAWANNITTIKGSISGLPDNKIEIYTPINGYSNNTVLTADGVVQLNAGHRFSKSFHLQAASFIKIQIDIYQLWLLVSPGDVQEITINLDELDKEDRGNWLVIKGNNSAGNQFFNHYNFEPHRKFIPINHIFSNISQHQTHLLTSITDSIRKATTPLDQLLTTQQISAGFHRILTKSIKASLFCEALKYFLRPTKIHQYFTATEIQSFIASVFTELHPYDPDLQHGSLSRYYIHDYLKYLTYTSSKTPIGTPLTDSEVHSPSGEKIKLPRDYTWILAEKDSARMENLWGMQICGIMRLFPDAEAISQDAAAYRTLFPQSTYLQYIDQFITSINQRNGQPGASAATYIKNAARVDSLSQLLNDNFGQKAVYIDLWATWCMPCLKEMAPNPEVDNFITQNDIARLYLSFDEPTNEKMWRQTINNYRLNGYHILANAQLKQDILRNIYKTEDQYSVPRYLIVSKKGNIITYDAPRPSETKKLINALSAALINDNEYKAVSRPRRSANNYIISAGNKARLHRAFLAFARSLE